MSAAVRRLAAVLAAALLWVCAWMPCAEASEAPVVEDSAAPAAAEVVDAFMAGINGTTGTALAVGEGGTLAVERYYGRVAGEGSNPVDARTAFEWGRCSDLVVWTCVMQMVEAGAFSLNDAVAPLLPPGVSLPAGYENLDVIDLMNHTAGLDVAMTGLRSWLPDGTRSVMPAFALFSVEGEFYPGDVVGYTPYDALLAAAIVEQASGTPFVDYADKHVFDRLGMDATYLMVGGSAMRLAQQVEGPVQSLMLASGSAGPLGASSPQASTSSVLSCFGPVGDLVKLANGIMGLEGQASVFEQPQTAEQMFGATRTYASLGAARIAHGMFAFPLSAGVYGMWATTSSGFSAAVYMDRAQGRSVAVLVNESGRSDLTQGLVRALVGRSDSVVANASAPENAVWVGTYQDASRPNHGPAKVLTALGRTVVSVNGEGVLTFDGLTATSLGAGVYAADSAVDQDVYRFHVSLQRSGEYSRTGSDSYVVPRSTLVVERGLLGLLAVSCAGCLCYAVAGAAAWVRGRLRRRRTKLQPAVLYVAAATVVASGLAAYAVLQIREGLAPSTLETLLGVEWAYVASVLVVAVWLGVTRWRDTVWTRRQNLACLAVLTAALLCVLNLVYWEMLP